MRKRHYTKAFVLGLVLWLSMAGCSLDEEPLMSQQELAASLEVTQSTDILASTLGSYPFTLDPNGISHLAWIFDTTDWTAYGGSSLHIGDDYYADDWVKNDGNTEGQNANAMAPGTVIYAGPSPAHWSYGNQVVVQCRDNTTFAYRYAHLQSVNVKVGDVVGFGTTLGKVGHTGGNFGPHLHSVLYKNISASDNSLANLKAGKSPLGYITGHPNSPSKYAAPFYNDAVINTVIIALKAEANYKYVCAENGGDAPLIANRTAIGLWEKFELIDLGSGIVALRALANNHYVCAENGGGSPLIANRTAIGLWEKFRLIDLGGGKIALLALANNRYVCAENGGNSWLIANRTAIGPWERFYRYYVNY